MIPNPRLLQLFFEFKLFAFKKPTNLFSDSTKPCSPFRRYLYRHCVLQHLTRCFPRPIGLEDCIWFFVHKSRNLIMVSYVGSEVQRREMVRPLDGFELLL